MDHPSPTTMAAEENTFDFTRLPNEVGDRIARNFGTIRQLAAVRAASRSLESAFAGTTFKAVLFQDNPDRVMHQLSLFCQLAKDEANDRPPFRSSLCQYIECCKIIVMEPAALPRKSRPSGRDRTGSQFAKILDIPRKPFRADSAMPALLHRTISFMENCTHLELVLDNMGDDALLNLSKTLSTAEPWDKVKNLRMITGCRSVERKILKHMVPKLKGLHIEDFKYGYTENAGLNGHSMGPGSVLLKAERCHKNLKRLHIVVGTQFLNSQELFPPLHLFKRIVGSFCQLQWLGVDLNPGGADHTHWTVNPEDHTRHMASELAKILKGFKDLKRLSVRVPYRDIKNLWHSNAPDQIRRAYELLTRTLAQGLGETVLVAVLEEWPTFYTLDGHPSDPETPTQSSLTCHKHDDESHRGWPFCLRNDDHDHHSFGSNEVKEEKL